ncbi:hypothetical protein GCM10028773_04540 [Spirosoma koreense]
MVPIKGLVNNQANSPEEKMTIRIADQAGHILQELSCLVLIKGKMKSAVTLYSLEETVVLLDPTQSARLPLRFVHNRNRAGHFTIDIRSLPEGLDRSAFPLPIKLLAGQDTTITFEVDPLHNWSTRQPYQLIVNVLDDQKTLVGTMAYKLVVAVANKRFLETNMNTPGGYGASAALTWLSTNQWAREVRVWGSDSIGKAQLEFHLNYLNYGSDHFQQLQNSFVSLRTNRAMVRLGTSYDYHELALFGRGLKVNIGQPDRQLTVWAINANPNWFSPYDNIWTGNIFSVRYDRQMPSLPGGSWSVSSNYFTQTNTMREGYLNFASFRYDQSERHSLQLLGSQSVEFASQGADRARRFGWAGQLNYAYQSPKLNWQLRSYFSNPVYSGLQRGASLVYSQLFWQPSAYTSLVARVNHMGYDRVTFSSAVDYTRNKFSNTVAELSVNHRINQLSLGLRPYWFSQSDMANSASQRADAYRIAPSLAYHLRSGQHIEFSYDVGLFHDRSTGAGGSGQLSQRIVSTIIAGPFSFWGYFQKGPYYLFDLRNIQSDKMMTASLTPTLDFAFFNRKLFGSIGLNYLYDGTSDQARYITVGRVQCDPSPGLSIQLTGNGTPYSARPELSYSLYRMEVVKRLNSLKSKHRGQLQLRFFEDTNGNGIKDTEEGWMDSLLVTINENTLMTNAKGNITYRHIPPGDYKISAISANRLGDPVLYHESISVGKSVTKTIPLSRTFRVAGQLRCQTNTYDNQPCQFNRFAIDIIRDQKTISSTSPLPDGTFSVHLSPGNYQLQVHDYGRQPHVTAKATTFTLTETGQYPVFDWTVDGSTRPVDVKRFTAK